jgi:hypothetical protein
VKKSFEKVINNFNNEEKNLLFGSDCKIVVNYLKYSTNSKKFVLDCKLLIKNPELLDNTFPEGVIYLANESWKIMGFNQDLDVIVTTDLLN